MVVPRFVQQALAGEPITVYGDGTQTRCFTHVNDVVSALQSLMASPQAIGQVVNIGGQEEISMMDLAKRVKAATASASPIVLVPFSEAYDEGFEDMPRRVPDVTKLTRLVGKAPAVDLDAILKDVIGYFSHDPRHPPVSS